MLLAGADVSGDDGNQHKIISIVVGTRDSLYSLHKNIGLKKIHMQKLDNKKRAQVIDRITFDHIDRIALSFLVNKINVVHEIHDHKKRKNKYADINTIFREFDLIMLRKVKPFIENFTVPRRIRPEELVYQVDDDMKHTIRNWGIKWEQEDIAHEFADAVAYCHNKNYTVPKLQLFDWRLDISSELKKKLLHR
ncbi:MAG TPA: hypothetical protein OQH54_02605 [Nitrosopumilus sp.]|nr:hypothetical protein [Thermoproteota archaeon]HJJ22592.1 hypothetical protein [Nitrosopumilus sp.]